MPRSQANVHFDIWDGLGAATPLGKLFYTRLLSEKHMNQAGIGPIRLSKWARDIGLPVTDVLDLMVELEAKRYAYFDEDADEFLLRTLVRGDGVADIPNVLHNACRCALLLRSPKLRRVLAAELYKLPPQPPDKVIHKKDGSTGVYVYPDPHGTAAAIDPGPIPDDPLDPDREPRPAAPPGTVNGHPLPLPAASHRDPIAIPSATDGDGMPPEAPAAASCDGFEIPSPWVRGGGGGGGELPVEENSRSGSACSQARAPAREAAREAAPEVELPAEAADPAGAGGDTPPRRRGGRSGARPRRGEGFIAPGGQVVDMPVVRTGAWSVINPWRAEHSPPYRTSTYRELAKHVDALLSAGAPPELVRGALDAWDARPGHAAPGLLPHLYDDAVRASRARPASPVLPAASPSRIEAGLAAQNAAFDRWLADNGGALPSIRRRTGGA